MVKLLSYLEASGEYRAAVRDGDEVFDAAKLLEDDRLRDMLAVIENWGALQPSLADALGNSRRRAAAALSQFKLAPPVRPRMIYCIGRNYEEHVRLLLQNRGEAPLPNPREQGLAPIFFLKPPGCIAGPDEVLPVPSFTKKFDYEVELVAVIGPAATNVSVADALKYVVGYTIGNDLSARDIQREPSPDVLSAKAFTKSCLIGPEITLAKDVEDPQSLSLRLWVDDELRQDSSTSNMIYSTAEQISFLSSRITLMPGDLVMTGTPAGTAAETGRYLQPGQKVRMEIDGLGEVGFAVA